VTPTREPGGTPLGEEIRALLLGHRHDGMALATETLLMFRRPRRASGAGDPAGTGRRSLGAVRPVHRRHLRLSGRRTGVLPPERIAILEDWAQGDLRPDLTLVFDLPVAVGLERAGRRGAADRFEREEKAFFERIRAVYLDRARRNPNRYRIVDASRSVEAVRTEVEAILAGWLERR